MMRPASFAAAARALLCTVGCATALLVSADARQAATQPQQAFRSSVDIIQLDVKIAMEAGGRSSSRAVRFRIE